MNGIVLKRLGHNVRILEQNTQSQRSDFAAGITTHPQFEEFMKIHDHSQEPWSVHSPGVQFLNKASATKYRVNKPLQMTSWGVIYHRLRANFDGFASDFCPNPPKSREEDGSAVFELGKRVTGLSLVDSGIEVTYEDLLTNEKGTRQADLVILANGANSALHSALLPPVERAYAGYVAFRGTVPESEVSDESKKTFEQGLTYYSYKTGYILLYTFAESPYPCISTLTTHQVHHPRHRRLSRLWPPPL
jgi:2-polyprenyl-6-methoxyphenol hydroxylase-like FAD-dependent oxidoreductase